MALSALFASVPCHAFVISGNLVYNAGVNNPGISIGWQLEDVDADTLKVTITNNSSLAGTSYVTDVFVQDTNGIFSNPVPLVNGGIAAPVYTNNVGPTILGGGLTEDITWSPSGGITNGVFGAGGLTQSASFEVDWNGQAGSVSLGVNVVDIKCLLGHQGDYDGKEFDEPTTYLPREACASYILEGGQGLTIAPEPSSSMLIGLSGIIMLLRRRR